MALIEGRPIMVMGQQKGRDTRENLARRFGMPNPEGYRKALRLMQLAERFRMPILTLVDTPGAYPGLGAEERGQAEAIAVNLREMARLEVPIVTVIIGEGGSGGALAVAVSDVVLMFENSIYSVISPEGCASILWRSADMAPEAAEALAITSTRLKTLGLIDKIVPEPLGGAHRDPQATGQALRKALAEALKQLQEKKPRELSACSSTGAWACSARARLEGPPGADILGRRASTPRSSTNPTPCRFAVKPRARERRARPPCPGPCARGESFACP